MSDKDALDRMRQARGYLLPHHGLLAQMGDGVVAPYEALYFRLAAAPPTLDPLLREFLWLVILSTIASGTATHHMVRFREAGGSEAGMEVAVRMAALPGLADGFGFAGRSWAVAAPGFDAEAGYRRALPACAGLPAEAMALGALLAHACKCNQWGTSLHLRDALAAVPEGIVLEALGLIIFPAGLPCFVQAAWIWRDLVRAGDVPASAAFQAWAAAAGQDGAAGAAIAP